jgi:hypothetical protein
VCSSDLPKTPKPRLFTFLIIKMSEIEE